MEMGEGIECSTACLLVISTEHGDQIRMACGKHGTRWMLSQHILINMYILLLSTFGSNQFLLTEQIVQTVLQY